MRKLRAAHGLSQEALAVDAGIDRTYVSRLERGLDNPTVVVLEKLTRALSSNIEELFSEQCGQSGACPSGPARGNSK
jgi:transcriptional regulator with XRE-family HTH domain